MLTSTLPELRKLFPWQCQCFHIQCLVLNIVVTLIAHLHKVIAHVKGFQACNHCIRHTSISSSRHHLLLLFVCFSTKVTRGINDIDAAAFQLGFNKDDKRQIDERFDVMPLSFFALSLAACFPLLGASSQGLCTHVRNYVRKPIQTHQVISYNNPTGCEIKISFINIKS
jgi:hypothetical protein